MKRFLQPAFSKQRPGNPHAGTSGLGLKVEGLEFRAWGLKGLGLGFNVRDAAFRIEGVGYMITKREEEQGHFHCRT